MTNSIDPFITQLVADEPSLGWFGFTIRHAHAGAAIVTATVSPSQVNGNGVAHGGVVFALADQAFAMAANTLIPHAATADAQICYFAPGREGDELVATAHTSYSDDRRAVIDVDVTAGGTPIALYRGTARATRRA